MRSFVQILIGVLVGIVLTLIVVPAISKWTGIVMPMWVDVLLCFAIAGAFGGVLGAIEVTDIPGLIRSSLSVHWTPFRIYNVTLALTISSLGGVGGGMAAMFAMAWNDKIKAQLVDVDRLMYIGLGTVAGFLGFKLLKVVSAKVDDLLEVRKEVRKQMEPLEKQVEQVEKSASELAAQERRRAGELANAIHKYWEAKDPNVPSSKIADAIAALEKVRRDAPDSRMAAMMLGWLYANKQQPKDPRKAITILSDALTRMKALGTEDPVDVADILYNRACYHYRLADAAQEQEKTQLKELMYKDIEESVRLKPDNARAAREEPVDFANVRAEAKFRAITGQRNGENPPAQNAA